MTTRKQLALDCIRDGLTSLAALNPDFYTPALRASAIAHWTRLDIHAIEGVAKAFNNSRTALPPPLTALSLWSDCRAPVRAKENKMDHPDIACVYACFQLALNDFNAVFGKNGWTFDVDTVYANGPNSYRFRSLDGKVRAYVRDTPWPT